MTLSPIKDRIIVLPDEAEDKTKTGLIIPGAAKRKPLSGKVVAVGNGTSYIEMELKEGDRVIYGQNVGTHITHENKEYLVMRQSDILSKIT